jgi:uncharacterized protein (DUF433 family)
MPLLDRITIDPAVRFGKPCVRGTRMTVGDVLGYLAGGTSEEELLEEFPGGSCSTSSCPRHSARSSPTWVG